MNHTLIQMRYTTIAAAFLVIAFVISSCNNGGNNTGKEANKENMKEEAIRTLPFDPDSAYAFVKAQVDFGPRVCNTKAHEKCAAYLVNKLKEYCKDVTVQSGKVRAFDGTLLNFKNIIASFNPNTNNRIFICAHWDSRPFADHDPDIMKHKMAIDGANDGASGVGILLEVARQLSVTPPSIGVDIIFLDAEDYGPPQDKQQAEDNGDWWGLGSQYWAKNPHKANYYAKYGILLDMVGGPNATFLQEGFSREYAPTVLNNVWSIASKIGFAGNFLYDEGGYITDDHLFINKIMKIPTIDIIHLVKDSPSGFYHTWHTTGDNLASIDKTTLDAVGKTLMAVIANEK
jgi:hypothetical protein